MAKQERVAPEDEDGALVMRQAIVGAASIAMRDGTTEFRAANAAWAEGVFAETPTEEPDVARQVREGLRYNPLLWRSQAVRLRSAMGCRRARISGVCSPWP